MAERCNKADVRRAFEEYVTVTGDTKARLCVNSPGDSAGTRYYVINAETRIRYATSAVWLGGREAFDALNAFVAGYQDGAKAYAANLKATAEKAGH